MVSLDMCDELVFAFELPERAQFARQCCTMLLELFFVALHFAAEALQKLRKVGQRCIVHLVAFAAWVNHVVFEAYLISPVLYGIAGDIFVWDNGSGKGLGAMMHGGK